MNSLRRAGLSGLLGVLFVGCGSSADTQSNPGGSSTEAVLEFGSGGQSVVEDGADASIVLVLSRALSADLTVAFAVSGTAVAGNDYSIDPGTVSIPAGDLQGVISLTPLVDGACEDTETVILTLVSAAGATLGAVLDHTVEVLDANTDIVLESEPNDEVASADGAGTPQLGRCVEIRGNIQEGFPDPFDVFEFTTGAAVLVTVELQPARADMDMLLFVTDGSGALLLPAVQNTGAGEIETVAFEVDSATMPEFNLSVSSFGPQGDYVMRVTSAALPLSAPPALGDPWLTDWAALKESLRSGRGSAMPRANVRPIGFGVRLDAATGSATGGLLVAPH
ncbi:MAG: hypothetical protein ACI8QZ_003933 [Chlamydiales bacterium]|jgi:hypothetical protein